MTCEIESAQDALVDVLKLLPEHIAFAGDRTIPHSIDVRRYVAMERRNTFRLFCARCDEKLLGYMVVFIYPHLHIANTLTGSIPFYYVTDCRNRALVLRRMLATVLAYLKQHNVPYVSIDTEIRHSCGTMLKRLGFSLASERFTLWLDKPP